MIAIIGARVAIVFGVLSCMGLLMAGLSWVIKMHLIPINNKLDNLISNDLKHLKEDIKYLKEDMEKIKTALKIK